MQAWTFILCLLGQVLIDFYMYVVAGCANVLEYPVNSTIACDASNCTITCQDGYVFYDGNITKTYSCDGNGSWAPSVPSVGCLVSDVKSCIEELKSVGTDTNGIIYKDTIFSNENVKDITIKGDVNILCIDSYTPTTYKNGEYVCVPKVPLVGVNQFTYTSVEQSTVLLFCEIVFGKNFTQSLYWKQNIKRINILGRFSGGTLEKPSLRISRLENRDSGKYTCHAESSYGVSVSPPINLTIISGDYGGETESITPIADITYTTHFLSTDLSTQGNSSLGKVPLMTNGGIVDEYKTVFIGIGTGCGGLLIILLIVLALIKSSKKKSASTRNKYKDSTGNIIQKEGEDIHDIECDGLKDNLLYISSEQSVKEEKEKDEDISTTAVDDGLQDNILYISSDQPVEVKKEQHADFTTKVVDDGLKDNLLYISSDQPINEDASKAVHSKKDQNKYSTTASKVNESNLQPTSISLTGKSEFQNKAFHLSDETISHKDNSNTYAVVNKHKQTDVYAVPDKHKLTDVYAVVHKNKYI